MALRGDQPDQPMLAADAAMDKGLVTTADLEGSAVAFETVSSGASQTATEITEGPGGGGGWSLSQADSTTPERPALNGSRGEGGAAAAAAGTDRLDRPAAYKGRQQRAHTWPTAPGGSAKPMERRRSLHDLNEDIEITPQRRSLSKSLSKSVMSLLPIRSTWTPSKDDKPYFPERDNDTLEAYAAQLHAIINQPETSQLSAKMSSLITCLILITILMYPLETMPQFLQYSHKCSICAPVRPEGSSGPYENQDAVEARLVRGDDGCHDCEPEPHHSFYTIEVVCVALFTIEYVCKIGTAWAVRPPYEPMPHHGWRVRLRRVRDQIADPLNIVDLLAILPFYVGWIVFGTTRGFISNFTFIRMLRLIRILRLYKSDSSALKDGGKLFWRVYDESRFALMVWLVFTLIFMYVLSSLVYAAEKGKWDPQTGQFIVRGVHYLDPDMPSMFTSIPMTFWWLIVTFTTVGYGDMYPVTDFGRLLGAITVYIGVFLLALPLTVVGGNFNTVYQKEQERNREKRERFEHAVRIITSGLMSKELMLAEFAFSTWLRWTRRERRLHEYNFRLVCRQEMESVRAGLQEDMRAMKQEILGDIAALLSSNGGGGGNGGSGPHRPNGRAGAPDGFDDGFDGFKGLTSHMRRHADLAIS